MLDKLTSLKAASSEFESPYKFRQSLFLSEFERNLTTSPFKFFIGFASLICIRGLSPGKCTCAILNQTTEPISCWSLSLFWSGSGVVRLDQALIATHTIFNTLGIDFQLFIKGPNNELPRNQKSSSITSLDKASPLVSGFKLRDNCAVFWSSVVFIYFIICHLRLSTGVWDGKCKSEIWCYKGP